MKILITGASGWLGSELTERLLEEGNSIRAFVLLPSKKLHDLKERYSNLLEVFQGNICDKASVDKALENIEIVYHLAAKVHSLPKNKLEEEEIFNINAEATRNLFELCIEHNVKRVIFYSSVSVYGESERIIDINSPKNPVTAYAKSKLVAEEIGLTLYKEKELPIVIIEPVTVYGGDDIGNFEKLKMLISKGIVPRFGKGENNKTIIYYKDLINMTINIAKDEKNKGKVIICGSEVISYNEILNILAKSNKGRVLIVKVNNTLTNLIIKLCQYMNISVSKKIARQITVLKSNAEYEMINSSKYLKNFTKFEDYYG